MNDQEQKTIDVQARQKAGRWGHDKGFVWVSREEIDRRCLKHRIIVRRVFFGRRVTVVEDMVCRLRAIIRKGVKGRTFAPRILGIEKPVRKRRRKTR